MNKIFFKYDPLAVGTKGLVYIGDNVLIYRRDNKTIRYPLSLDLPGGGAEADETPFQTFQREIKEEFGLSINKEDVVYTKQFPSAFEQDKFGWFAVAKLPESAEQQIVFGDEGIEYFIMPLSQYLSAKDAWPLYQERSADYANHVGLIQG